MTKTSLRSTALALAATAGLLLAACGGSDSGGTTTAAPVTTGGDSTPPDTGAPTTDEPGGGDFVPGEIEYRVVNLLDEAVDLYGRTQGFVEAFLLEGGVAPGAVTDFYAPPATGIFLVTQAGAGDPECVSSCDHFIAELSPYADDGPLHTVVLYSRDGQPASFDLWESPEPASEGNANAMAPADPDAGVVVVTAIALTDADFGLRFGLDGVAGCQDAFNLSNVLVGGNQTPAFTYDGSSADVVLYDNRDTDCTGDIVGGPFTISGGAGTRTHLILTGSPGSMDAVVLPFGGDDSGLSGDARRDAVVGYIAESMVNDLGIDPVGAECIAEAIVDALGVDNLYDGDTILLLDELTEAQYDTTITAIAGSAAGCGVDPSQFG